MNELILTLNAGSSSTKFAVFEIANGKPVPCVRGQFEGIGTAPHFVASNPAGVILTERRWEREAATARSQGHAWAFQEIWQWLERLAEGSRILAVGHRVTHGGEIFAAPVQVTPAVIEALTRLIPMAPLHQPHNVAAIQAIAEHHPALLQVACFDTAFHRGRAAVTERFALPRALLARGVKRYGFHGLSYEHIVDRLAKLAPELANGRIVVAHLGSGCSMAAIRNGKSVETTMGFSTLDGLPMGTRSGALDPGVLLFLMREGLGVAELEELLYRQSGMLGLSGIGSDLRLLQASGEPAAAEAIDYLVYRIGQSLGALCAALGGLDALVFTAGIGENDAEIRSRVCRDAQWLGVAIDEAANASHEPRISLDGRAPSVWVIPTDEDRVIARHTLRVAREAAVTLSGA